MDKELEINAKNEAEAVRKALEELGLDAEQVETEVEALGQNSRGIFKLVAPKEHRFLIRIKTKEAAAERTKERDEDREPEKSVAAESFLKQILDLMKASATIKTVEEDADKLKIEIEGEDSGILIGRRGQTLDALQYLLNIVVNKDAPVLKRIVLDVEEYRARRASELEDLARRAAKQAIQKKAKIALRPMSAYERRIIHVTLQDNDDVETVSEGEEPDRKVLIVPKE